MVASHAEGIAVGDKFYGYYPMAATEVLTPSRVSTSSVVTVAESVTALRVSSLVLAVRY